MNLSALPLPSALQALVRRYGSNVPRPSSSHFADEDAAGLLQHEVDLADDSKSSSKSWTTAASRLSNRRYLASAALILLVILLWLSRSSHGHFIRPLHAFKAQDAQFLYILSPALYPSTEACKSVLTAEILHYPIPTMINLGLKENGEGMEKFPDSERITIVVEYLKKLPDYADESLVILLGTSSAWFQLRPDVLLNRYYDVNRKAEERLARDFGKRALKDGKIRQTVVFSAQNKCTSHEGHHPACYAVPESPLLNGMHRATAPRFLNIGSIVGPVKDLRTIFERAAQKAGEDKTADVQKVLSELFAEQEIQREITRRSKWSWMTRTWNSWFGGRDVLTGEASRQVIDHLEGEFSELGMGLDYAGEIAVVTGEDVDNLVWKKYSSNSLPPEIAASMPPFWSVSGGADLPAQQSWSDLDLLTDTRTSISPALIVNDPSSEKNRAANIEPHTQWWPKLWLQPFARPLLGASVFLPVAAVASVVDNNGTQHTFWNPLTTMDKAGIRTADQDFVSWEDMCREEQEIKDIFLDDKGPWVNPAP
ncbi:Hypothetical protein R9X50_00249300 [Acrodontium crateriforme]|uniref:Uncharacterized protein n=1 Tax=Acrodontium crateriforme TaxID=150365 RepID=A0AAQ3M2J5_9PEZI|nr:Hypothetical protein R9X50_00249300 [Acrodontium crateriforme]